MIAENVSERTSLDMPLPNLSGFGPDLLERLSPIMTLLQRTIDDYLALRLNTQAGGDSHRVSAGVQPAPRPTSRKVGDVAEDLLAAKLADGLSKRYLETLRSHLRRFAAVVDTAIDSVSIGQIETWLRSQDVGPRARNNMRASVITLFRFARKQGYLARGTPTEADEVSRAKEIGGKIGVLTPAALETVLSKAPDHVRLFVLFGAFTGMRSSEILRLDWADVNMQRRFITVAPQKAKTATRRLVPIFPNLFSWLHRYANATGTLFGSRRDAANAIAFAKSCGVEWPNNALRHSYATYRLAITADAPRVALEMGNSPQKLITNYRELAGVEEAEGWFNISPEPRPLERPIVVAKLLDHRQ
jgi:integrase